MNGWRRQSTSGARSSNDWRPRPAGSLVRPGLGARRGGSAGDAEARGGATGDQGHTRSARPWLPDGLDGVRWRGVVPGVRQFPLSGVASERGAVRLLAIAPGTTLPHHGHQGSELTLVLRGSYADEIGRFGPGDLADLDPDVQHQPIADTAALHLHRRDRRAARFGNLLGRVVQPLLGF